MSTSSRSACPGRPCSPARSCWRTTGGAATIADKARDLIWRLWSDVGQPGLTTWQGWQQSAVLDLRQAALADAIFDAEPFIGRALERSRAFQATGAVESYDRVLATIGAVHPYELSARAARLLAPNRAHQLFLRPVPEAQRPAPGVVGVPSSDNLPMETRFRLADLGAPPSVSAPAGLRDARLMTLPNGLTVVLVPRPQFPSVTALLGFHGGSAALPPGVLEMVRVVEAHLHKRHPTKMEVLRADGRGFTADFVRTDRRRLSNALYSLADRLKTVAATDWQGLLARAQATATPEDLRSHDEPRMVAAGRMLEALYGRHPYGHRVRGAGSAGARSVARAAVAPVSLQSAQRLSRHRRRHRRQRRGLAGIGLVRELARSGRHGTPDGASRRPARHPGHPRDRC